jgi:hypothetical protein
MNEAELTRECVRRLNKLPGVFCAKVHGSQYQRKGLPDIVGCAQGKFFGIEMKVPGRAARTSPSQDLVLRKIRKAGGRAGVATSFRECMEVINGKSN